MLIRFGYLFIIQTLGVNSYAIIIFQNGNKKYVKYISFLLRFVHLDFHNLKIYVSYTVNV